MRRGKKILILFTGIPASGKSTLISRICGDESVTVISPDRYIGYTEASRWTPEVAEIAWEKAKIELEKALDKKTNDSDEIIIFDATLVSIKARGRLIRLSKEFNVNIISVFCIVPMEVALNRNNKRDIYRKVPEETMFSMEDRLEEPNISEGFDLIVKYDSSKNISILESFSILGRIFGGLGSNV
jgi:predicted kinase